MTTWLHRRYDEIGMGIGAAGAFSSMAQQMFAPMNTAPAPQAQPFRQAPSGRFTRQGAAPAAPAQENPMEV